MTTAVKKPGRLFEIGKQVDLPLNKIADIAWRNMKHRFGRSIVTTSGVILATAFLMAMLIKNSMVASLLGATRSLNTVTLTVPLGDKQAADIRTVLADQQRDLKKTMEESKQALEDATEARDLFQHDVDKLVAGLAEFESAPGVAIKGKESEYKSKRDEVAQYKRDLQTNVTGVIKANAQYLLDKETVDRTAALLAVIQPGYVLSTGVSAEEAEKRVAFLRRLGNQLEGQLQSQAIEEAPKKSKEKAAAAGVGDSAPITHGAVSAIDGAGTEGPAPAATAGSTAATAPKAAAAAGSVAEDGASTRSIWLTSLALIVAGVGITNAMLMSVTERFREIGTMKCLGALDGFIMKLFLIESAVQGGMGTLLGLVIGTIMMLAYLLVNFNLNMVMTYWPWAAFGMDLLTAFAAGLVISIIGAAFPSLYASRMDPIAAMRQEI